MKTLRFAILAGMFVTSLLGAEPIKTLEFRNQDLKDILLTFGELNKVSIVPDDTVEGRASYVFANMEFAQALQVFLDTYKLSSVVRSGIYYVSKVSLSQQADGTIDLVASDVPLRSVIRALSTLIGKTILYDNIGSEPLSINVKGATVEQILQIFIARYPDFIIETKEKFYYLRAKPRESVSSAVSSTTEQLIRTDDTYQWAVEKARFRDLLLELFGKANLQFLLLMDRDQTIENLNLKGLTFDEALKALLLMGNGDYSVDRDIYTIFEVQRRDLMKRYLTNLLVPLQYISVQDLTRLLPPALSSGSAFKADEKANKVILSGSQEEIRPILDFLELVDRPATGSTTQRVDLQYLKSEEFIPLLPAELAGFGPVALPAKNGILISIPEAKRGEFEAFRTLVDRPPTSSPVRLRFLKADDLFSKLPPSVTEANLSRTNDPSLVFFKGTDSQLRAFRKDLESIDQPRPLLRYEVLVLQVDEGKGLNLETNYSVSGGKSKSFSANMGKLLNFGFDVVGNFGVGFGMSLSAALSDNNAKVVADTTLNGLSGEKISFQNTTTYRYIDYQIDPTTGKNYATGTLRELSSGLLLSLEGWISADNMITLKVETTLSKQAPTASGSSNSAPSTSEKKIATLIRTPSGKPLIIGGLKQEDTSLVLTKTPFLGDIPLLGLLFQKRDESISRTEFSLYIVPILERPEWTALSDEDKALALVHRFYPDTK